MLFETKLPTPRYRSAQGVEDGNFVQIAVRLPPAMFNSISAQAKEYRTSFSNALRQRLEGLTNGA